MRFKINKYIILPAGAILVAAGALGIFWGSQKSAPAMIPVYEDYSTEEKALISLMINELSGAAKDFYQEYLTIQPSVFNYLVEVKQLEDVADMDMRITFLLHPFVGAHNFIGDDEATFTIDSEGNVELLAYHHLKGYKLPEHLSSYLIKPLP